jgi:flagellar basal-body rod modification protein FlgD
MTVMSVSEVYSQTSTPQTKENGVMGKDDFLTLLVAQLQHQDPLNPAESTEFTAQLAQFSSLEQLENIDATLSGFEVYQATLNNIQSSGFIGKTVTATGSMFGSTAAGRIPSGLIWSTTQTAFTFRSMIISVDS